MWVSQSVATVLMALAVLTAATGAGTIRVLSAVGMRQAMLDLGPKFERMSGHRLEISFDSSGVIAKRVESGEPVDVVLVNQPGIDRLQTAGRLAAGSVVALATSIVAVAVRNGTPGLDISTAAAFKSAALAAGSIALPDPALDGSSGTHLANVFERLGIAAAIKPKLIYADPPGPGASTPGSMLARGTATMALHQMQELMPIAGISIVGPLPNELQQTFVFSAAVPANASDHAAAQALIDFLRTPEARTVFVDKGMGVPGAHR